MNRAAINTIKSRLIYISLLLFINIYNIIILSLYQHGWFLIPITVINFLSILHSLFHIFYTYYYNSACLNVADAFCLIMFEVLYNVGIALTLLAYMVELITNKVINWYEFSIFLVYCLF